MNDILAFLTLRTVLIFFSTAFSLLFIMLVVGIVTVDDVVKILNLSPDAANAFKVVVSRIQEVTGNILEIISQLINKLFSWAGVDVDLNKIHVNTQAVGASANDAANSASSAAGSAVGGTEQSK